MNIAYVLESGGLAGGHKLVLEHLTRLTQRGHHTKLFFIYNPDTAWFPNLQVTEREVCFDYTSLIRSLRQWPGPKVATWWRTAKPVAESGGGFYFSQDVEMGYAEGPAEAPEIRRTYDLGLTTFTSSVWVQQQLATMGVSSAYVGVGIDRDYFYPAPNPVTQPEVIFHERDHYLKGPDLRRQVLFRLNGVVRRVGYAPWHSSVNVSDEHLTSPTDQQVAERMRNALCVLVTSLHEGFCLPAAEAMACGIPVVTTNADGNTFCRDGYNCLMGSTAPELANHVQRLRDDHDLWLKLRRGALETAYEWDWNSVMDRVEQCLTS